MQFGASVWPFQWEPPYEEALRRIARLGFRAVELIAWDRDTLDTYYTPARTAALRALLDGEGLRLSEFVYTEASELRIQGHNPVHFALPGDVPHHVIVAIARFWSLISNRCCHFSRRISVSDRLCSEF